MSVQEKYSAWVSCPAMTDELSAELRDMLPEQKHDAFYRNLAFGTGGLRGVLGAGTNRMNCFTVVRATRGLAAYLKDSFDHPSCAVSYDSRIHSRDFAELTAAVLAEEGVHVWIYSQLMPTPMLSFAVRYFKASGGVMITASHNPARFNGYKVYGPDGCQITLKAAEDIQDQIETCGMLTSRLPDFSRFLADGMIEYIPPEAVEAYYQSVLKLRKTKVLQPMHLVYSPLNGTGNVPVREILSRLGGIRVDVVTEQELPDGRFPTCPYPNPEVRDAMKLAIDKTIETGAEFCFATDPDCDRMGAGVRIGNKVELISGNDMGILMLDYLCRNQSAESTGKLPPVVVKTIVSTDMAASLCDEYGLELRNVLTGFKFIGEQIGLLEKADQADRFLFGFEESYGYLSGTDVRDKDAVNAALLLCELASDLKSHGKTIPERLNELREKYGVFEQRLLTFEYEGENGAREMSSIMESLRQPLASFGCAELQNSRRTDYLNDDTGLPASDVICFVLSGDMKFFVRPSGTEPKLKAYLFAHASGISEAKSLLDQLETLVNRLCK